ncbi:MAG: hypothetical protein COB15_09440, partial [Flavobacteriales bacterium]
EPDYFFLGMQVQFDNPNEPDGNPFETFYEMENEGGKYNEETKCFELDGKECAPYCVGLQY